MHTPPPIHDLTNHLPQNAIITGLIAGITYLDPHDNQPKTTTYIWEDTDYITANGLANTLNHHAATNWDDDEED